MSAAVRYYCYMSATRFAGRYFLLPFFRYRPGERLTHG